MGEKPKYRMGTGEKAVLWGAGTIVLLVVAVAIPALLHQRNRSRATATAQKIENQDLSFFARALKRVNKSDSMHASINLMCRAYGAPHVSVGRAAQYPDMALITIVWPTVHAEQIMINPDETRSGAVPPMIQQIRLDTIPVSTTNWNCRVDDYGNIVIPSMERQCLPDPMPGSAPPPATPSQPQATQPTVAPDTPTSSITSDSAGQNGHHDGIPQDMIPLVPITSLVEIPPRPELVYPAGARAQKIQGMIQVEVTVSTAGVPVTAVSLDGPGILRTAAENWQMKRRFKPPVFEGLVQPVKFVNGVNFTIEKTQAQEAFATKPATASPIQPAPLPAQASGDQPPRVATQAPAVFPQRARQMRWETSRDHAVMLKIFVGEQGQPLTVKVVEGASFGFDEAAIEAANKSTFTPAMKNGHPVRAWLEMRVVIPKINQ